MPEVTLLLSIHKNHAENIFAGNKRVELRKTKPRISSGERVLVYISSPVKALMGFFIVEKVVEDSPSRIWSQFGDKTGISKREFNQYYESKKQAYAIVIDEAKRFPKEIPLDSLRETVPNFHPPQCYRYLNDSEMSLIGV